MSTRRILACLLPLCSSLAAGAGLTREQALQRGEAAAARLEDRFVRTWTRCAIAEEWATTDPARAADLADKLESWTAKRDLLSVVMFAWGQRDPKAAAEWGLKFQERTPGSLAVKNTALTYAVVGMVQKDPRLADDLIWKHLKEESWGNTPRTAPMLAARELARVDPKAALAMAEKITGHEGCRVDALRGVLREWAAQDPQAAQAALAGRKEREFVANFPRDLAEGWAHKDPAAAAAYAKTVEDRLQKVMALALVAREMARTDPQGAAALCSILCPLNVGKWHEQMPRVGLIVGEVAEGLARKGTQAATKWAESLPEGYGGCRANAIDGVAAGWAASDLKAALAYYEGAKGTGAALPALARELAKTDIGAALTLVGKADRLVLKSNIIRDAAVELAKRDPEAAAGVVESWAGVVDYYTYRTGAAAAVASAWAAREPKAASAWAAKLAPVRDRLAALRGVATAWAKAAPADASAWAEGLADPEETAYALVGLAEGLR